jgi:formate hydrogenlyase transcriptional activator
LRSYVITPLIVREKAIGTFNIGSKIPRRFRETDSEFLSLVAKQIALAMDNARAHEEIERLRNRLEEENIYLQEEIKTEHNFEEMVGESRALKKVLEQVEKVATTGSTFLLGRDWNRERTNCSCYPFS